MDLPTYAFQHRSYWLTDTDTDIDHGPTDTDTTQLHVPRHPLLGAAIDLAAGTGSWFGTGLTADRPWYLDEHRLLGVPVMPAAAMVEWALAAACAAEPGLGSAAARTLGDVAFTTFLPFPNPEPVAVQASVDASGDGVRVRCFSRDATAVEPAGWREHVTVGAVEAVAPPAEPRPADLDGLLARIDQEQPVAEHYARLRRAGVEYGPAFRGIQRLYRTAGAAGSGPADGHEALALVAVDLDGRHRTPEALTVPPAPAAAPEPGSGRPTVAPVTDANPYVLHPVVLDGCLQIVGAFVEDEDTLWLPAAITRITVQGALPDRVWCHARQRGQDGSGAVVLDIEVLTEAGQRLVELTGVEFRAVARGALSGLVGARPRPYEVYWRPAPLAPAPSGEERNGGEPREWLLYGEDAAACEAWQAELAARGDTAVVVLGVPGEDTARTRTRTRTRSQDQDQDQDQPEPQLPYADGPRPDSSDVHQVDPDSDTALAELFARLSPDGDGGAGRPGLLLLGGTGASAVGASRTGASGPGTGPGPDDDVPAETEATARRALLVLKHYLRGHAARRPLVVVCSTGAAAVRPDTPRIAHSALTAAARAVVSEYPEVKCVQVDLDPRGPVPAVADVLARASGLPGAGHLAVRQDDWYEARLRLYEDPEGRGHAVTVRPDGTYLVTGGLGGVGLATAVWLAGQGARSLVLVGRTVPAEEPGEVAALRARGVRVESWSADVTDAADVARVLADIRRDLPPLRGLVHAAGITQDAPLAELPAAAVAAVMAPKVRGAWQLHRQTQGMPLDFFVLYSSLASQVGSVGQANYIAGNAFLDALAGFRRNLNLPCTSISWGPWAETGMAVRSEVLDRLASVGVIGMPSAEAFAALGRLPAQAPAHLGLVTADWYANSAARMGAEPYTLLADVAPSGAADLPAAASSRVEELARLVLADRDKAAETLLGLLLERVAALLGISAEDRQALRADFARTELSVLGLDSLTTIRLRNVLLGDFGADVPPDVLLGGSTAADVVEVVCRQLAVRAVMAGDDEPLDSDDTEVLTL